MGVSYATKSKPLALRALPQEARLSRALGCHLRNQVKTIYVNSYVHYTKRQNCYVHLREIYATKSKPLTQPFTSTVTCVFGIYIGPKRKRLCFLSNARLTKARGNHLQTECSHDGFGSHMVFEASLHGFKILQKTAFRPFQRLQILQSAAASTAYTLYNSSISEFSDAANTVKGF